MASKIRFPKFWTPPPARILGAVLVFCRRILGALLFFGASCCLSEVHQLLCAVVSCLLLPARDVARARTTVSSHLLHSRAAPTVVRTRILRLVSCHLLHVRGAPAVVQQPCKQHQHTQDPSALTSPSGRARRTATAAAATLSHKSHINHNTNVSYSRQGSDGSRTSSRGTGNCSSSKEEPARTGASTNVAVCSHFRACCLSLSAKGLNAIFKKG